MHIIVPRPLCAFCLDSEALWTLKVPMTITWATHRAFAVVSSWLGPHIVFHFLLPRVRASKVRIPYTLPHIIYNV